MRWIDEVKFDEAGLVPVVAQEAATGEVLMLAYASREALEHTTRTGRAHYWSRSRAELWEKGATSGHTQEVVDIRLDCDGDAVLYRVRQRGPACHTLEHSCFHRTAGDAGVRPADAGGHVLARLEATIGEREAARPEGSYTTYLFTQGLDKILKKVGEESAEVIIAAKNDAPTELRAEVSDLIFHLLVLLRARDLPLSQVWAELEQRVGRSSRIPSSTKNPHPDS